MQFQWQNSLGRLVGCLRYPGAHFGNYVFIITAVYEVVLCHIATSFINLRLFCHHLTAFQHPT
jgi:hypothetical protein